MKASQSLCPLNERTLPIFLFVGDSVSLIRSQQGRTTWNTVYEQFFVLSNVDYILTIFNLCGRCRLIDPFSWFGLNCSIRGFIHMERKLVDRRHFWNKLLFCGTLSKVLSRIVSLVLLVVFILSNYPVLLLH